MKRFLLLLIALATPPWFSQAAAQEKPRYGGTLNVGIHSDLYGLNPFVRMRSIDRTVRSLVYETLVSIDSQAEIKPFLAESWKISAEGREYTFNLRRRGEVSQRPGNDR